MASSSRKSISKLGKDGILMAEWSRCAAVNRINSNNPPSEDGLLLCSPCFAFLKKKNGLHLYPLHRQALIPPLILPLYSTPLRLMGHLCRAYYLHCSPHQRDGGHRRTNLIAVGGNNGPPFCGEEEEEEDRVEFIASIPQAASAPP